MLFEIRIMGRIAVSGVRDQSFQMTDAGYLPFPSYDSSNVRVWKKKLQKNAGQSIENVEILDIRHACNINMSSRG